MCAGTRVSDAVAETHVEVDGNIGTGSSVF
jgi:hypothetical protein